MPSLPEDRIRELNLTLPQLPKPLAKYKPALMLGNLLYVSGHLPIQADGKPITGRLGADLTTEQGHQAARQSALAVLSTVRNTLGSLNRVKRLVKTMGLVNCTPGFIEQPKVINGFSELMADVFGEDAGVGVRSAFGAISLPANAAVEVECIFEVSAS